MKQFKQTLYITILGIKGNCFIEFSLVKSITYKIWVPPTKLFFGSKVILQTDNSQLVLQLHCQTTHYYTWRTSGLNSRPNALQPVHE